MKTSMSGFTILDHPADLGFKAWAPNLPDLFAECARALTSVVVDLDAVEPLEISAVEVLGDDIENLLYNWLSEILYMFDGEKKLFHDFAILRHTSGDGSEFLQAELKGEPYQREKHAIKTYVKAVTYHQLQIRHGADGYTAQVYLDI